MPYKEGCGFREKVDACNMREDQCRPEKKGLKNLEFCGFYELDFTMRAIKKKTKELHKEFMELHKKKRKLEKEGKKKTDEYKETKKLRKDRFVGLAKLGLASKYLSSRGQR